MIGLLLLCSLLLIGVQIASAQTQRVITNFQQVLSLPEKEARQCLLVSLTAWVMSCDPDKGTVLTRETTASWNLMLGDHAETLRPGQRIRFEARTRWNAGKTDLVDVRVLEQLPEPPLKRINPGDRARSADEMEWVEVEGTLMFAGGSGNELVLDITQRGQHLSGQVAGCEIQNVSGLLHSRIRLRGLVQGCSSVSGEVIFGRMWVGGLKEIQIVNPTVQDWNSCRVIKAEQLQKAVQRVGAKGNETRELPTIGSRVRVSGRIEKADESGYELRDDTGAVTVAKVWDEDLQPGTAVEVLGILGMRQDRPVLYCAWTEARSSMPDALPLLTTIEQIHRLKPDEAGRGYPVRIRGVATGGYAYIQDETRGISISNAFSRMIFGGFYQVEGNTGAGLYAPLIEFSKLTYLGPGQLPEPIRPTWGYLATGSAVCQWIEIKGIVLSVQSNWITIAMRGGRVQGEIQSADTNALAGLANTLVRIRGTCRSEYNEQRHLTRFWISVPSPEFISLEEPLQTDPFTAGVRTITEIRQFDVDAYQVRRTKLVGQVTYHAGQSGYLSDGTNGIKYTLREPATLSLGDNVELVGFPDADGFAPVLREALWHRDGHAALPEAPIRTYEELLPGKTGPNRVRVRGAVLATSSDLRECVLTLLLNSKVLTARVFLDGDGPRPVAAVGSTIELTGVCASEGAQEASGDGKNSLELLVQSPADVLILKHPSWWTLKHSLQVIGILVAGLLLALAWGALLRAKVAERTRQLKAQMAETERTERQRSLEQERSRIARDLHDNLGSSLTEISMLAETGHRSPSEADKAQNRFGQILDRAQVLVRALDETVWAVDPGKDTLPSLVRYLAGFAEEFVSTAGIRCRVEVPATVPDFSLTTDLRHDLFLATKEVLNNAVSHASPTQVTFRITIKGRDLQVRIIDDGRGFDPSTPAQGNGVRNLRERMSGPDRRCEIESKPGSGTTVLLAVTLPVTEVSRAL